MVSPLLDGKVAVITGAGRGIGRATAELLAGEGARLLVTDMEHDRVRETADAITGSGGSAHALAGDVTEPGFPDLLVRTVRQLFGRLDVLVNNAGFTWDGMIHKMTDVQWQTMIDVHLTAPFRIIRAAVPLLRDAAKQELDQHGRAVPRKIVNVSSTSGTRGNFGQANYASAKAGIIGLTKTLAREWGRFNIQVNCVAFGIMDTRLTRSKEKGETIRRGNLEVELGIPEAIREASLQLIPMGRPGTPAEAAGAILFFTSPLGDYVSGQVLEVSGGL
jgi:3-oxoacyl-[acyl-carrier protein] reductase